MGDDATVRLLTHYERAAIEARDAPKIWFGNCARLRPAPGTTHVKTANRSPTLTSSESVTIDAKAALDALDDGFCIVGQDWRVRFANPSFVAMLNLGESESWLGREFWEVAPIFANAPFRDALRGAMADGRTHHFRADFRDSSLDSVFEVAAAPLPGDGGLCIHVRDVRDAVRFEQELAERSEENASLREVARALAEEVDLPRILDLICTEAAAQCAASGTSVGELRDDHVLMVAGFGTSASTIGELVPLAGSLTARAIIARAPVTTVHFSAEYPRVATQLDKVTVGPALAAPLIAHGEILGVVIIVRERGSEPFGRREERRVQAIADHAALALWKTRLFEQAQEANRTKAEFMATMSHELRTPLTALAGYEELLADRVLGPLSDAQLSAVERMRTSTELLTSIIEEILIFSRIEAGEERAQPEDASIAEIVNNAIVVLEPLLSDREITLAADLPPDSGRLVTDPDLARRILVNLGSNAIKFTTRGSVTISAWREGDAVVLAVRDTGIGIAPHDLTRLFQPFRQLESGFTRRFGGTGLGLYVSRRLAHMLGGEITVESTPGVGSVFTVRIAARLLAKGEEGRE
jgi:signal transduction histidine kinase/PAS domain-containing protein